jgi:hypothetical protein
VHQYKRDATRDVTHDVTHDATHDATRDATLMLLCLSWAAALATTVQPG